jgi:hypothetical protein
VEDTCHKQAKAVNEGSGKRFVEGPIQNHSIPNNPLSLNTERWKGFRIEPQQHI